MLDSEVHLDNKDTLKQLIEQNRYSIKSVLFSNTFHLPFIFLLNYRNILSPVMKRYDSPWSNVWGDVSEDGYYKRSEDYLNIVDGLTK